MALTDEDEYILKMVLDETGDNFPTGLQVNENEVYGQDSYMVNVYDLSIVSDDSTTRKSSLKSGFQTSGISHKRCTDYDLQDFDIPKRKCMENVQLKQDVENNSSCNQNSRKEEHRSHIENTQLGEVVNNLVDKASTTDQKIEYMANKILNMEQEMKSLMSANMKLSERVEHLEVNGICCVCNTDKISIWVNPCKHWVLCVACCKKLREARDANNSLMKCPICRETIDFAVPFFGVNDEIIHI